MCDSVLRGNPTKAWESSGFPCVYFPGPLGAFCGYVGVPPGHPWHGSDGSSEPPILVHGGVTFAEPCGCSENTWWVGFDCGHLNDFIPSRYFEGLNFLGSTVWTHKMVQEECERLADQAAAAVLLSRYHVSIMMISHTPNPEFPDISLDNIN